MAALHGTVPGLSPVVPDDKPAVAVSVALVAKAVQLDLEHRQEHGRPITRDRLRAALKVSNAVAGEVLRQVRSMAPGGAQ